VAGKARPKTLLKGNELNTAKAKKLDLVLRRKSGESKFSEMLLGDEKQLVEHKESLKELLSDELLKQIADDNEESGEDL